MDLIDQEKHLNVDIPYAISMYLYCADGLYTKNGL